MAIPTRGGGSGSVFLSYRREDTRHLAGRLYDRLAQRFGHEQTFMVVDTIQPGAEFAAAIDGAVAACDVLVALIGPGWLHAGDVQGERRLNDPDDFVVLEITAALKRNIRILPVLVDGATPPPAAQLPEALVPLARRNAMRLDHETFRSDVDAVLEAVARYWKRHGSTRRTATKHLMSASRKMSPAGLSTPALNVLPKLSLPGRVHRSTSKPVAQSNPPVHRRGSTCRCRRVPLCTRAQRTRR
jgi:hypothetical protein